MTDYTVGATIHIAFTTRAFATGIPTVLIGTAGSPAAPVVSAYEDAGLVQITAGITLGVDHDSPAVVGLNMLTIVATGGNGFESGKDYNLVITNGTVGGVSVVGEVVGSFTLGRGAAAVDLANGTDGLSALKTLIDAIPTTAMRGTDNAGLASVLGALADGAAADEVTTADTLMQYIKQLVNILVGAPGVVTLKAAAAPASGVSLSEMIRAIYDDTAVIGAAGAGLSDLGGMSTGMKAEILVEINAALDAAISELSQGVPSATPSVRNGIMLMYMALRNKLDVATSGTDTLEVHNDAGTRIAQKLLTDAGGDYSEAKMISGA